MPLPSGLRQLVGTAAFWSDYLGDAVFGEPAPGLPDDPYLDLPLSPRHSLRVGYFWRASGGEGYIEATRLHLRQTDGGRDLLLGWRSDDGHAHPHALRWEEAALIGQLQAVNDPELPHPGVPFLLLLPYIASVEGSDHRLGLRLLDTALRSLGVFDERQIRYRLSAFNQVPAEREWRRVQPHGWVCHFLGRYSSEGGGRPIYSLRHPPSGPPGNWPQFPFGEWNDCMRHAERVVAETRHSSAGGGRTDPPPVLPERVELRYQVTDCEAAYSTVPVIRRALFRGGLGVCFLGGGWKAFEDTDDPGAGWRHPNEGDEYVIEGYGELAEIVAVIRRAVEGAGRPEVRLYQTMPPDSRHSYRRLAL